VTARDVVQRVTGEMPDTWMRKLLETTKDAVVAIDREGKVALFNPAAEAMFGYEAGEILGQPVTALMAEPYRSEHDGYVASYEQTGERRAIGRTRAVSAQRKSGETFPVELQVMELEGATQVPFAAFIRDTSEKMRLQQALVDRERLSAVGLASAKLAHEVGNPLNSIAIHMELVQRRLAKAKEATDPRVLEQFETILSELARLRSLLREFRAMARRPRYEKRAVDVRAIVHQVVLAQQGAYAQRRINLERRLEAVPPIVADPAKLEQVLLNLCDNAAHAMAAGGLLVLVVAPSETGGVRLEVIDQGPGIPPNLDVFEPFVTTKPEGTGLGLAICREIVLAHGGTLAHRPAEGGGTVFSIDLPPASPQKR
jgi:two-component system sensor kinase FixL